MKGVTVVNDPSAALYAEIEALPNATVFHTRQWHDVLRAAHGWRVRIAVVRGEDGRLLWALPFVSKRRYLYKRVCIALPLTTRLGPALAEDAGEVDLDFFRHGLWPIEIHAPLRGTSLVSTTVQHWCSLDLSRFRDEEELFRSTHEKRVRQQLRRAKRAGIHVVRADSAAQYEAFGQLLAGTRRRLGSAHYPVRMFTSIFDRLGASGLSHLFLAKLDERLIAGEMVFRFRDVAQAVYAASVEDREMWRAGANQVVRWAAIRDALSTGARTMELGASPLDGTGLRIYKEAWGGVTTDLVYTYGANGTGPASGSRPGGVGKLKSEVFRRMPFGLYRALTPLIQRIAT